MKYSIIIPTLNEEKLLTGLLQQLNSGDLKKKYSYEIILSDGGSTDETVKYALPYADIIKVHQGPSKQNIARGRNEGAKYASGEILIFLNADILFSNVDRFFSLLEINLGSNKFDAFTCYVQVFPAEQKAADYIYHFIFNNFFFILNEFGGGMGRGECQVIRKDIFKRLNGYNENMAAGEDLDLFRRTKKVGKILFSREICIYESPRRYRKYGYFYITLSWIKNGLSVLFKNKSLSKVWEEVR